MTPAAATSSDHAETLFATPAIVADRRADGSIILKSTTPLQPERALRRRLAGALGAADAGEDLSRRARQCRRAMDDRHLQRCAAAGALGRRLDSGARAERRAPAGDPLRQQRRSRAVRARGAMHVGVPSAAISPAYSLMSRDFDKLKSMIALLEPGAIYVSGTKPFAAALAAIKPLHSASDRQRRRRTIATRSRSAPSRQRRKRLTSQRPSRR